MEVKTNSVFEDGEDRLEHYGRLGMHWGVWNAETRARYLAMPKRAGKALQKTLKSAGSSVAKGANAVKAKADKKIASKKAARLEKNEQKKELAQQRKELGMTRAKYNELREQTLRSHDPKVVARGMQTLTDKELNAKIERLRGEDTIRKMAADQATRKHQENKARSEAIQANPLYKIGKDVLYKKLGLSGKGKDKKNKNSGNEESTKADNQGKGRKNKGQNESQNTEPSFDSPVNSPSAKAAASKGKSKITNDVLEAQIISVETIYEQNRKELPPGRG